MKYECQIDYSPDLDEHYSDLVEKITEELKDRTSSEIKKRLLVTKSKHDAINKLKIEAYVFDQEEIGSILMQLNFIANSHESKDITPVINRIITALSK